MAVTRVLLYAQNCLKSLSFETKAQDKLSGQLGIFTIPDYPQLYSIVAKTIIAYLFILFNIFCDYTYCLQCFFSHFQPAY